jgi:hypothetical protein
MRTRHVTFSERALTALAALLVLRVTVSVVLNYHNYLPPNFFSDFLRGRESYFFGSYRWAFYAHIISGPVSLIVGLILVSDRLRLRIPRLHRILGYLQVALILLMVAPSGLWMAYYAAAGPFASVGLAALAISTATCAAIGLRAAMERRFVDHRRWM